MKLDKIILENFLTYKDLEYNFSSNPLLVQGRNLTEEDQESNGSGKSGIFSGIEFCIAGSNSRDVRDKELVMFGEKEARTQLFASCDVRKESIHIDWTIKVKGSNVLTLNIIKEGASRNVSFSNVNDGKRFILNWFDIEKEDLFNYYIINKSRFKSFFKASNKEKVELINRFSDASIIDGLDKIDTSDLKQEHISIKANINKVEGMIEVISGQILEEKNKDVEAEIQNKKEVLAEDIAEALEDKDNVSKEIKEINAKASSDLEELSKLESDLKALEINVDAAKLLVDEFVETDFKESLEQANSDRDVQYDLLDNEVDQIDDMDLKSLKVNKLIKDLEVELSGAITCPSCSTEFTLDCKHGSLDDVKSKMYKAKEISKTISLKVTSHEDKITSIKDTIKGVELKLSSISKDKQIESKQKQVLINSLNSATNEVQILNKNILRLTSLTNEHKIDIADCKVDIKKFDLLVQGFKAELKNIDTSITKSNLRPLEERLVSLRANLDKLELEYNDKGDEIYRMNQWINNFKQFRMHLANQSLEAIEFQMNRYLVGMQSDLKVKLEGFKMLANGTFKEEITAKIIRNVERTFSSFSGGEQGRLLFAAILANRYMINSTHKYGGLDFLSIDEVFEGVDSLGLKKLVKSAKQLEIAVMIITHVTDEEVNDDILLIEKVNGISNIKN
mgnify:CR=1 FL=1